MLLTIKNALIATMNNANQVFFGDIESDGHNITRINARPDVTQVLVGPITQRPAEGGGVEIDGNGCLALPGLVNGHIHSYRNALRFAPEEVRLPRQADG